MCLNACIFEDWEKQVSKQKAVSTTTTKAGGFLERVDTMYINVLRITRDKFLLRIFKVSFILNMLHARTFYGTRRRKDYAVPHVMKVYHPRTQLWSSLAYYEQS